MKSINKNNKNNMEPKFIELLGKGTMGEVYLCMLPNSSEYYALKKIKKKEADRPQVKRYFKTEVSIMKELKHNNIIRLINLQQTTNHYYIIMEYCNGGSLLKCLKKYMSAFKKPFSQEYVQHLMRQIVNGLTYIHDHNIIHRDIKLDNILVKFSSENDKKKLNMMNAQIKICDFGISIRGDTAFTAIGTPAYMDPFILKKVNERNDLADSQGYNKSADIWSLGAVCYEMLIGKRVFNGRNMEDLYHNVESGNYTLPTNLSKEVVSFINGMLQYDPDKRLTAKELSRHHFLTRNIKDFHKIDLSLMTSRIGANGIKINTIKNNKIWEIFNENEELLNSISSTNFLEKTPSDEGNNKNVVPQFPKNSFVNIQKLNNLNNIKPNNFGNLNQIKNNKMLNNKQKQNITNNIHHDNNLNINNSKPQTNDNHRNSDSITNIKVNQNNNNLSNNLNSQKNNNSSQNGNNQINFSSGNLYNRTNNISPNVYNQNNNINQFISNQSNNTSSNVYNQNNNNISRNIYNQFKYNTYNQNNYNTHQNLYNQNNNNTAIYGNYSINSSIHNFYNFPK